MNNTNNIKQTSLQMLISLLVILVLLPVTFAIPFPTGVYGTVTPHSSELHIHIVAIENATNTTLDIVDTELISGTYAIPLSTSDGNFFQITASVLNSANTSFASTTVYNVTAGDEVNINFDFTSSGSEESGGGGIGGGSTNDTTNITYPDIPDFKPGDPEYKEPEEPESQKPSLPEEEMPVDKPKKPHDELPLANIVLEFTLYIVILIIIILLFLIWKKKKEKEDEEDTNETESHDREEYQIERIANLLDKILDNKLKQKDKITNEHQEKITDFETKEKSVQSEPKDKSKELSKTEESLSDNTSSESDAKNVEAKKSKSKPPETKQKS